MATTYTTKTKLAKPATGDTGWELVINADLDAIDALAPVGALAVSKTEVPSASLNVAVSAGTYITSTGVFATYAGTASQAMTTASTNYVYILESTGLLTVSTSAFPTGTTKHVRLATVVAGASTITSITDNRIAYAAASVS